MPIFAYQITIEPAATDKRHKNYEGNNNQTGSSNESSGRQRV